MTSRGQDWSGWIGRTAEAEDAMDVARANALQATLESEDPEFAAGDFLPPLWHWCYFWQAIPLSGVGRDGHGARGAFLPPIELPRRMWAGSRVTWHEGLPLGAPARRVSTILDVVAKEGRSGPLAFVTVKHEISGAAGLALTEEHDIVYRAAPQPGEAAPAGRPAPADLPWRREISPDPVLLFRYSALTFNGHRIHYDHPYVTEVEGYPGLIVHGPLLATLMVDLARRAQPARRIAGFSFRALSPIFDTAPFSVAGRPLGESADLWVVNPAGDIAMQGQVVFG